MTPGTVTLEARSPLRTDKHLLAPDGTDSVDGTIHVKGGLGIGGSFFDGIFAAGGGFLTFDTRDIKKPFADTYHNKNWYIYLNFQPVSTLRAALKRTKP